MIGFVRILTLVLMLCSLEYGYSLEVNTLSINNVVPPPTHANLPVVVERNPVFGWVLSSEDRCVRQQAYEIIIYADKDCRNQVFSTGTVESSSSVNVGIDDFQLQPESKYYWRVRVRDNHGNEALSEECAEFVTGLGNDWGGAVWMRPGEHVPGSTQKIEADICIGNDNIGVYFGVTHPENCFMWEIDASRGDNLMLRRFVLPWGLPVALGGDVMITGIRTEKFKDKVHHIEISVFSDTGEVVTLIDGTVVDRYMLSGYSVQLAGIGFMTDTGGNVSVDNVKVEHGFPDGKNAVVYDEEFSAFKSVVFPHADIIDGRMKLAPGARIYSTRAECPMFYRNFNVNKDIVSAVLYASAIGNYTVKVNGEDVCGQGYGYLLPGWTYYKKRAYYSAFDVTRFCRPGANLISSVVTTGWARGKISNATNSIGYPLFRCKLVIEYSDGSRQVLVSDTSWRSYSDIPLLSSDIYTGDVYDARKSDNPDDFAASFEVLTDDYDTDLTPFQGLHVVGLEPLGCKNAVVYRMNAGTSDVNVLETISNPKNVKIKKGDIAIFDFGQNHAGVPDFSVRGDRGTLMQLRFAEILNDSGDASRHNDGPAGTIYRRHMRGESNNTMKYVLAGDSSGESYHSTTTYYGYRYCEVTATDDIELLDIESIPLTSSFSDIGAVETDSHDINRLFNNIMWGQRSNLISVPIDCPSRDERLGWGGDALAFANTAMMNADVSVLLRKWLCDMRDSQRADGAYSDIAPVTFDYYGSAAWADAGVVMTWYIYLNTGDISVVSENYDSMCRYMDYLDSSDGPTPTYGDWLAPVVTDPKFVSRAYYALDAWLMYKMSMLMSTDYGDSYGMRAAKYREMFDDICSGIQTRYFDGNNLMEQSQGACVLALAFGLCRNQQQVDATVSLLKRLIEDNGYKLSTGFVATPFICPVLSKYGLDTLAYRLLMQRQCPSWLYELDNGATTMWEYWHSYTSENGLMDTEINSFNHCANGAVGEWMYNYMAGIRTSEISPGFKEIIIEPHPDRKSSGHESLGKVKATYKSKYGLILSEWNEKSDGTYIYHVIVPVNTSATVRLPIPESGRVYCDDDGNIAGELEYVEDLGLDNGYQCYRVGSGEYWFEEFDADTSLDEVNKYIEIHVRPNPVSEILYVDAVSAEDTYWIYSMDGIPVMSGCLEGGAIDVASIPSGIYILMVQSHNGVATKKIVKK